MGNINWPRFNEEDFILIEKIDKYSFVDMDYIYKFYKVECKPRTVRDRIRQLAKYDYLNIIYTFIPYEYRGDKKNHSYTIITLGNRGVELLNSFGIDAEKPSSLIKNNSPYRIYHQVQLATVCDEIEQRFKNNESRFEVHSILSEKEIYINHGKNMPDAVIVFYPKEKYRTEETKDNYVAVFIEIERSYASRHRVEQKMYAYNNNFNDGSFIKKIGLPIKVQRLLFVSQTDSQYKTIKDKINSVKDVDLEILCGKYSEVCNKSDMQIYENPRRKDDKKYKLLSYMSE